MARSLSTPGAVDELIDRLQSLSPDTPRRWGTMTTHEMLCHVADSFRGVFGERPISKIRSTAISRHLTRLLALHVPLPWPKGIPTVPEIDPKRAGTRPAVFEADRHETIALLNRFAGPDAQPHEHFAPSAMSRSDWQIWACRRLDHHLRQFDV